MKCIKIFNCAAALISENPYGDNIDDLVIRAADIINTFIYNTYDIGNLYEQRFLKRPEPQYCEIDSINDTFPLCDDIAGVCIYYLASVLVSSENYELSEKLRNEYQRLLDNVKSKIPADINKITDIY